MDKLQKLQIKVIDDDFQSNESSVSQPNACSENSTCISTIKPESLITSDFWLNTDVISTNGTDITNGKVKKNDTLPEITSMNIYTMCQNIKNIQNNLSKFMICNTTLFFIWFVFLCTDIYYMIRCPNCCENNNANTLGIFSTCILVFLVCKYGFMTCLILFLWYKLHKMFQFLNRAKHLVINLQSEEYFDDTQQMGLSIRYIMLFHQAIKKNLQQTGQLNETNRKGPFKNHQYKESPCVVNLENMNMSHQTVLPFLNLYHKDLSLPSINNKYILLVSTLDVIPLLTLIIYGCMFLGTQTIHLTHICGQFFTFLCVFFIVFIIFSCFLFIMWLIYFLR